MEDRLLEAKAELKRHMYNPHNHKCFKIVIEADLVNWMIKEIDQLRHNQIELELDLGNTVNSIESLQAELKALRSPQTPNDGL